ncbi:hypothetical protein AB3Y40_05615 [Yoonia sp. R2331]|uniref:hypothetical protein n=1 Tax=Yoonia sp. R2331 TaxID=3237238 RepID=UPI0034E3E93F
MEIVYLIIGGMVLAAVVVMLIERKRGRAFRADLDRTGQGNSHADRELTRIDSEISDRTMGHRDPH